MWKASSWGASMAEKALGSARQIIPGVCDINTRSICDVAYHWNNLLGLLMQVGGRETEGKVNMVNVFRPGGD